MILLRAVRLAKYNLSKKNNITKKTGAQKVSPGSIL